MNEIKKRIEVLRKEMVWQENKNNGHKFIFASLVLCAGAMAMLIMNIKNNSHTMAVCSVILVVGFLLSTFVAAVLKNNTWSGIIIALLVSFVLSIFAITAGNQGFAILWILLVPCFAVGLLGIREGFSVATYFLVFLFVLFYTPLNSVIAGKYTEAFCGRFPILYTCDYLVSMYLSLQMEYYYRSVHMQSYLDEMTGCFNRRFFLKKMGEIDELYEDDSKKSDAKTDENVGIIVIDVNGLKQVNDNLGHDAGDELIKAVPECCKKVLGEKAVIARMGGDEYAILITKSDEEIHGLVQKMKEEAEKWRGEKVERVSFSVGWASKEEYPEANMDLLYIKADEEMYEDKRNHYKDGHNDRRKKFD